MGYDSSVIGMDEDAAERGEFVVADEGGLRWRVEVDVEEGVKACTDVETARRQVVNADVILGLMIVVGIILVGIKIGCGVLNNDIMVEL